MKIFFTMLLSFCFLSLAAQTTLNETLKQQMLKEWARAKAYTDEYLNAMPADKYGFKAVDSIRSFAQQMLHLAVANVALAGIATDVLNDDIQSIFLKRNLENSPTAQSKDSVAYYVNSSYDFVMNSIKNQDFSKITDIVTHPLPGGLRSEMRLTWLMKTFEHQTHHRGQCTIYLRLVGIRPPAEKLF